MVKRLFYISVLISALFSIGAAETSTTTDIYYGRDSLEIDCRPTDSGNRFRIITFIQIRRNITNLNNVLVSIYPEINGAQIAWQDVTVQERAIVMGDISSPLTSFLTLLIGGNETLCEDGGGYQCLVGGLSNNFQSITQTSYTDVKVIVIPSEINIEVRIKNGSVLQNTSNNVYEDGIQLEIICYASVGNIQKYQTLYWTIQIPNYSETGPISQSSEAVLLGELVSTDGCEYTRNSTLTYYVSTNDTNTTITCTTGNDTNQAYILSRSFTISVAAEKEKKTSTSTETTSKAIETTSTATETTSKATETSTKTEIYHGRDSLQIDCRPSDSGNIFRIITFIQIRRNISILNNVVVSIYPEINGAQIAWQDVTVQERAVATGDISSPLTSFLTLLIAGNETLCEDEGGYQCLIGGLSDTFRSITQTSYIDVKIIVLPSEINTDIQIINGTALQDISNNIFAEGTELEIICNASVGNIQKYQSLSWTIQISNYSETLQSSEVVLLGELVSTDGCEYTRNSTLTYYVSKNDTNTTITCTTGNGTEQAYILSSTVRISVEFNTENDEKTTNFVTTTYAINASVSTEASAGGNEDDTVRGVPTASTAIKRDESVLSDSVLITMIAVCVTIATISLIIAIICISKGCKHKMEKNKQVSPSIESVLSTQTGRQEMAVYKQKIDDFIQTVSLDQYSRLEIKLETLRVSKQTAVHHVEPEEIDISFKNSRRHYGPDINKNKTSDFYWKMKKKKSPEKDLEDSVKEEIPKEMKIF